MIRKVPKNSQAKTKTKNKISKKEINLNNQEQKNSIWSIFKFGESYTSLILGIIVVVVATITLLSFVKSKNEITRFSKVNQQPVAQQMQQKSPNTPTPEITKMTTAANTISPTKPETKKISPRPTVVTPTVAKPTMAKPTQVIVKKADDKMAKGAIYSVVEGDSLWNIAERKYKNGYYWTEIQKANKISNADILTAGQKLVLPDIKTKIATEVTPANSMMVDTNKTAVVNKIVGNNYTVVKGDTLWDIAIRAYGDGFAWTKISSTNKLSNPDLIFPGDKLSIPRN